MGFLSTMNIIGSGITAQHLRLDVISENITNINTTRTGEGGPYRRKVVVFQAQEGDERNNFRMAMAQAQFNRRGIVSNAGYDAVGGVRGGPVGFQAEVRPHGPGRQRRGLRGAAQCGPGEGDYRRHGRKPGVLRQRDRL